MNTHLIEVAPGAELHDEEHLALALEELERLDYVGVVEGHEEVDLVLQLRAKLLAHPVQLDRLQDVNLA